MLLAFSELSDHAHVHTAGLPGRLTRFREAANAHAQEVMCAKVYKPAQTPVNRGRVMVRRRMLIG